MNFYIQLRFTYFLHTIKLSFNITFRSFFSKCLVKSRNHLPYIKIIRAEKFYACLFLLCVRLGYLRNRKGLGPLQWLICINNKIIIPSPVFILKKGEGGGWLCSLRESTKHFMQLIDKIFTVYNIA